MDIIFTYVYLCIYIYAHTLTYIYMKYCLHAPRKHQFPWKLRIKQ